MKKKSISIQNKALSDSMDKKQPSQYDIFPVSSPTTL